MLWRAQTWRELRLGHPGPVMPAPSQLLLYSLHAARPLLATAPTWSQLSALAADYPFLASLLPQHPAPLRWPALHLAARRADDTDGTALDLLLHALRDLLRPGPALDEAATLLLAVGLGHATPAALRQLRCLLKLYANLQAQLRTPAPPAVRERLAGWDAGVLKPVSAALLAAA